MDLVIVGSSPTSGLVSGTLLTEWGEADAGQTLSLHTSNNYVKMEEDFSSRSWPFNFLHLLFFTISETCTLVQGYTDKR